jgi:hypothetical protein
MFGYYHTKDIPSLSLAYTSRKKPKLFFRRTQLISSGRKNREEIVYGKIYRKIM